MTTRFAYVVAAAVLVLAGCSSAADVTTTTTPATTTTAAAVASETTTTTTEATTTTTLEVTTTTAGEYDPYQAWIDLGGPELWAAEGLDGELTRDDAQLRALLGCGQTWAAGTIDALLAEAYRAVDGFCS